MPFICYENSSTGLARYNLPRQLKVTAGWQYRFPVRIIAIILLYSRPCEHIYLHTGGNSRSCCGKPIPSLLLILKAISTNIPLLISLHLYTTNSARYSNNTLYYSESNWNFLMKLKSSWRSYIFYVIVCFPLSLLNMRDMLWNSSLSNFNRSYHFKF